MNIKPSRERLICDHCQQAVEVWSGIRAKGHYIHANGYFDCDAVHLKFLWATVNGKQSPDEEFI